MQDVLMRNRHLHLPGFEKVEALALLLVKLTEGEQYLIPLGLREQISKAAGELAEHDRSARNFVKQYESKWGYTLFGRCLGPESPQTSAAQKTKFGWMKFAQAAQITEESRLLYLVIQLIKNQPTVACLSPTKTATNIRARYKRICDRVSDDPVLATLNLPLPNINSKSITNFISKQEKRSNFMATTQPKVLSHRKVLSFDAIPDPVELPDTLPKPEYEQVKYSVVPHESGKRRGEKRRSHLDEPGTSSSTKPFTAPTAPSTSTAPESHAGDYQPKPKCPNIAPNVAGIPVLVVLPSQPTARSVSLPSTSGTPLQIRPAPPKVSKPPTRMLPNPSQKPCAACKVPKCGGLRKRYTPSKQKVFGSKQKIFTFCPKTNRSTTPGFDKEYESCEDFIRSVDEELERRRSLSGK